jgi:CO/xanthine dehydrogenase Mo-binding subunit
MPTRTLTPAPDAVDRALIVDPGQRVPGRAMGVPLRREGPAKLTGAAKYTDDLVFPGAWFGTTIRSTEPHAKLVAIELDPDVDWSKVVVATAADVPGENIVSSIKDDQPLLVPVGGEIRHVAEPVALLAAADRETLRQLKGRITLVTEPLEPVFDPEQSDHVFAQYEVTRGDLEAGFAGADLILEGEYRVGHQEQLYIENNAMIAVPGEDGGIVIHGSMQCPYYVHKALKRALRLTSVQARVIQEETGGGFGGKEEFPSVLALHASLLALKAKRPVRMIYERHEDIVATTKRHPAVVRHRTGFSKDGTLVAQDIEVIMDGGAYCTLTPVVLSRGVLHAGGPYRCPNVRLRGRATRTNTAPNGAFRGFGAPQTEFAAEMQMNRGAERLGISPSEIRRANVYRLQDTTPTGQILRESVAGEEVLEQALGASHFERIRERTSREASERRGAGMIPAGPLRTGDRRVANGIGLALAWHGAGFTGSGEVYLASVASVEVTADGRIRVLTANTEMGQGTKTVFPQMVAGELNVPVDWVEYAPQDTAEVLDSGPTVASRTVMVVGGLVILAARKLKAAIEARNPGVPFHEAFRDDARANGATRIDQQFEPYPGVVFDDATYLGDAYPAYGWAAAVASVEVDLDTYEVQVRDVIAVDDVGKVIHQVLCEGQVEGGTLQAVGYATIEEMLLRDGRYLNDRLATYLIPTALDAPHIRSILVEAPFSGSPHGAKGVGELPMDVGAPAVVAAIHDATGAWIHELPASPERILGALGLTRGSDGGTPPASDRPSTVRTMRPSTWQTGTRQASTTWPSRITEHAPHSPSPQPSFVPVRPRSSRRTSSSRRMPGTSTSAGMPLTVNR